MALQATVSEAANTVFPNGTIHWGDELPEPQSYRTNASYNSGTLQCLYSMARGFVNVIEPTINTGSFTIFYIFY